MRGGVDNSPLRPTVWIGQTDSVPRKEIENNRCLTDRQKRVMETMIVRLQTTEEVRQIRRKFYADPIFLLTSQLVMNRCLSLKPEELYATADVWVASLVENGEIGRASCRERVFYSV